MGLSLTHFLSLSLTHKAEWGGGAIGRPLASVAFLFVFMMISATFSSSRRELILHTNRCILWRERWRKMRKKLAHLFPAHLPLYLSSLFFSLLVGAGGDGEDWKRGGEREAISFFPHQFVSERKRDPVVAGGWSKENEETQLSLLILSFSLYLNNVSFRFILLVLHLLHLRFSFGLPHLFLPRLDFYLCPAHADRLRELQEKDE